MILQTVAINRNGERVLINQKDFNSVIHVPWSDEVNKPEPVEEVQVDSVEVTKPKRTIPRRVKE